MLSSKVATPALHGTMLGPEQFPLFAKHPNLHYLDSAATTQKPRCVIDAITKYYENDSAPVHRGLYGLAAQASESYEQARQGVARFINAPSAQQCVFTRSATESINLVAQGWAKPRLIASDEIWVSEMEHHANFLPWQRVCSETGATLRIIRVSGEGELLIDESLLYSDKVKLIALTHVSNVLGSVNPIAQIAQKAKQKGIPVLVDACQSVGHIPVDVQELDCAFMAFSAHKMYGPEGIGVLFGKSKFLDECEPLLLGGGMVDRVAIGTGNVASTQGTGWLQLPARLEAGSPNLSGAIGLCAAINFIERIGLNTLHAHGTELAYQARCALAGLEGVSVLGTNANMSGIKNTHAYSHIVSFVVDGVHPHDVAQVAADNNLAIRAGHHCAQPLMHALGLDSTLRASFAAYNTEADISALTTAVKKAVTVFKL